MRDLKSTFISILKALYRPVAVPFFLLILFLLANQFFVIDSLFKEKIVLELELYQRKMEDAFLEIENRLTTTLERLFVKEYESYTTAKNKIRSPFSEDFLSELRYKVTDLDLKAMDIQPEDINFYRIDEKGVVYDTDLPLDMGFDLSKLDYLWGDLQALEPGQMFFTSFDYEKQSNTIRFYSYIKLPNNHIFEVGIALEALNEYILQETQRILQALDGKLVYYNLYNQEESHFLVGNEATERQNLFLHESLQEDKPIFKYHVPFKKTVYFSWENPPLRYGMIISVFEVYGVIIVLIFFFTLFLIHFNYFRSKKIILKLTERLVRPIVVLENKMKGFNVKTSEVDIGQCESEISEVVSIHNSFVKMSDDILSSYEEMASMNEELEASYSENEALIEKIEGLLDTPQTFYATHSSEEMLCQLFKVMSPMIHETDLGLVSVKRDNRLHFIESTGIDLDTINSMIIPVSNLVDMKKIAFHTYDEGDFYKKLDPQCQNEEVIQLSKSISQALIIPVSSKNKFYGFITFCNLKNTSNKMTYEDFRIAEFYSHYLKAFLMIRELSDLEQDIQKETIFSIIRLLEQHDPYTKGHSENVAKLASEFAAFLKLPEKKVQDIYWAGLIHDMGKILIPHSILNKPGKLTVEEFDEIKKHPVFAYDVFRDSHNLKEIAFYVKYHHEKYNGFGYPEGLIGEAIPYESRILCIADAWDAMRAKRVYKKGVNKEESLKEMKKNKGTHFDPQLVEQWLEFLKYHSDE